MPTALIADDEELARRLVKEYLAAHADIHIVAECENGLQAVNEIERLNPDLVFLDIQMPKLTGLEVLANCGRRTGVIFTTAYDEYALKAFDLHAIDYLLKPFAQRRFDEALLKARAQLGAEPRGLDALLKQAAPQRILIRERGQTHVIAVDNIEYVEAQDDYLTIHADGKSWMKTQSLSELEQQLDPKKFVRVHRSYLLNIAFIQSIERLPGDTQAAILRNGEKVPISRAGRERLKSVI